MIKKKLHVLIIEDDTVFQSILEKKIKSIIDCSVTFCDTIQALKDILKLNPDLIISDYFLPDGTGFDVLDYVKKENLQAPTIFLSEQSDIEIAVELMEKGAHTYIEKSNAKLKKLDKAILELTPYFTMKSDIKNASKLLLGGRQLFVFALIILFITAIYFMFNK